MHVCCVRTCALCVHACVMHVSVLCARVGVPCGRVCIALEPSRLSGVTVLGEPRGRGGEENEAGWLSGLGAGA